MNIDEQVQRVIDYFNNPHHRTYYILTVAGKVDAVKISNKLRSKGIACKIGSGFFCTIETWIKEPVLNGN